MHCLVRTALLGVSLAAAPALAAQSIPGLHLTASPQVADVGQAVTFTLSATRWPGPVGVQLSFSSAHHGFRGQMNWMGNCSCFRVAVLLTKRIHPLEYARATASIHYKKQTFYASTGFQIRGLAANGKSFAPGGGAVLVSWVGDPQPAQNEVQHFCAWVRTVDGVGVAGYPVKFVVHYLYRDHTYNAGVTPASGIICTDQSIGRQPPGFKVVVDVYAKNLHATTSFSPR